MSVLSFNHDAGFFSCCSVKLIRIIHYFNENKKLPEIIDSSFLWNKYKDLNDNDVNEYFFSDPSKINQELKEVEHYDKQFYSYRTIDIYGVGGFVKKFFSPSILVENCEKELIKKYNLDLNKTISVFYRTHDKSRETIIPNYDEMLKKIKEVKEENRDHKLVVQSADQDFCDFIKESYEDCIIFEEIMKFDKQVAEELGIKVPDGEKKNQAILFLAIIFLISKSSKVILNSGNIGIWIVLFRGYIEGIHQYLHNYGEQEYWFDN
jgi:hypothetical protein